MLSKFMTAKRREAMAAPEIRERATMRKSEVVFLTVAGERSEGRAYAVGITAKVCLSGRRLAWMWSTCPRFVKRVVRLGNIL